MAAVPMSLWVYLWETEQKKCPDKKKKLFTGTPTEMERALYNVTSTMVILLLLLSQNEIW